MSSRRERRSGCGRRRVVDNRTELRPSRLGGMKGAASMHAEVDKWKERAAELERELERERRRR